MMRSVKVISVPPSSEAVRKIVTTMTKNLAAYWKVCSWIWHERDQQADDRRQHDRWGREHQHQPQRLIGELKSLGLHVASPPHK
jgi:hypothetical protein